jgi:hypothetical protein
MMTETKLAALHTQTIRDQEVRDERVIALHSYWFRKEEEEHRIALVKRYQMTLKWLNEVRGKTIGRDRGNTVSV